MTGLSEENVFPEAREFGIFNEDVSERGSSSNYVDVLKASQAILIDTKLEQEQSEPNFSQFRTRMESESDDDFIQQLHSEIQDENFEGVSTVAFNYNDGGMKKYVSASAQQAVQKELMAEAFADAKQQAEMIANLSGKTLGSVRKFFSSSFAFVYPLTFVLRHHHHQSSSSINKKTKNKNRNNS